MKLLSRLALLFLLLPAPALAGGFSLEVGGIENGGPIAEKFAFCVPDGDGKTTDGDNISPMIRWSDAPKNTKSFAFIVVDRDVPAKFDDANQEGKTIAEDFPRQDFYHWVLTDIPPYITGLAEGKDSDGKPEGGKPTGKLAYGLSGANDYATFMQGSFGGYDGPCPPWNDERLHHYHFIAYALDVASLNLADGFTGRDAMARIKKHTLAHAEVVGTFSNRR